MHYKYFKNKLSEKIINIDVLHRADKRQLHTVLKTKNTIIQLVEDWGGKKDFFFLTGRFENSDIQKKYAFVNHKNLINKFEDFKNNLKIA